MKKFRVTKHTTPDYIYESIDIAKNIAGQVRRHEGIRFSKNDKVTVFSDNLYPGKYEKIINDKRFNNDIIVEYVIYDKGTPAIWFELINKELACVPISIKTKEPINIDITKIIY